MKKKKTTAIFGPSECGKSTLIKLILRIYELEPNNGQILIDDKIDLHSLKFDISNKSELSLKIYRKNIGYVEQRPILLNDTIRNNILVGRQDISDETIWEKLKLLKMDKFIKSLYKQLDYIVGQNGGKLSGGQKQRRVLARAVVENPNILILYEATSSLNEDNIMRINNIINSLKGTKTIIFSTHDIRLLKNVDKIIMFNNDGTILEQGSPEDLIKENGKYAKEIKDRILEEEKIINEEEDEYILNTDKIRIKNIQNNKNDKVFTGFRCSLFQNKLYFILLIFFMLACGLLIPFGNNYCYKFFSDCYLSNYMLFIQYYFTEKLGLKLSSKNKGDVFSNLIKIHVGFFDNNENIPTKLSDFIITETSNINSSFLHLLFFIELFIGIFISGTAIAGYYSSKVTLIAFTILVLIIILYLIFLYSSSKEEELSKDSLYGEILTDNLNNLISLHANNYDDFIKRKRI